MATGVVSLFVGAWLVVSLSSPAFAYLDPITGSFLIQGLIAGAVAVLAAIRQVRERVLALVGLRKPDPAPNIASQPVHAAKKSTAPDAPNS